MPETVVVSDDNDDVTDNAVVQTNVAAVAVTGAGAALAENAANEAQQSAAIAEGAARGTGEAASIAMESAAVATDAANRSEEMFRAISAQNEQVLTAMQQQNELLSQFVEKRQTSDIPPKEQRPKVDQSPGKVHPLRRRIGGKR